MSSNQHGHKDANEQPKGHWIPWVFVGFFGVVLLANSIMIYNAFASWNGLAAQRSYDKGVAYNRNIEAQRRQDALGWNYVLTVADQRVDIALTDDQGKPLAGLLVMASMERPNDASLDFETAFERVALGHYRASFDGIQPGIWNVHLVAEKDAKRLVIDERVMMP